MEEPAQTFIHDRALGQLVYARTEARQAVLREAAAVHIARDGGVAWQEIGALYGTSKQAAQQRWPVPGK